MTSGRRSCSFRRGARERRAGAAGQTAAAQAMIRRLLTLAGAVFGLCAAGWLILIRRQGDSKMAWSATELSDVERWDGTITGTLGIENRGRSLGVVRRVEGRIVEGARGSVLATLRGSRPPQRGWWVSNILKPGESCVAEIDVVLEDTEPQWPLTIELVAQEMGRRVFQYRAARVNVPPP
jgi:hypothetical protein